MTMGKEEGEKFFSDYYASVHERVVARGYPEGHPEFDKIWDQIEWEDISGERYKGPDKIVMKALPVSIQPDPFAWPKAKKVRPAPPSYGELHAAYAKLLAEAARKEAQIEVLKRRCLRHQRVAERLRQHVKDNGLPLLPGHYIRKP